MAGLTVFLYVLVVLASILLIGLILIQPAKSGGMGAAFGGIGESVFGGKAGSHLTKTTVILTALFFAVALALAAFIGHGGGSAKVSDEFAAELNRSEETKPEVKSEAKPEAKPAK